MTDLREEFGCIEQFALLQQVFKLDIIYRDGKGIFEFGGHVLLSNNK
jgi:hypothetical protein